MKPSSHGAVCEAEEPRYGLQNKVVEEQSVQWRNDGGVSEGFWPFFKEKSGEKTKTTTNKADRKNRVRLTDCPNAHVHAYTRTHTRTHARTHAHSGA